MPYSNNKGALGGLLKTVNETTRTVNNVKSTTNSVKNIVGGNNRAKQGKQSEKKDVSWTCECGLTNTTKFCGGCGKPAPAALVCPKCKWKRPVENSSQKFCGNCGTKLED